MMTGRMTATVGIYHGGPHGAGVACSEGTITVRFARHTPKTTLHAGQDKSYTALLRAPVDLLPQRPMAERSPTHRL